LFANHPYIFYYELLNSSQSAMSVGHLDTAEKVPDIETELTDADFAPDSLEARIAEKLSEIIPNARFEITEDGSINVVAETEISPFGGGCEAGTDNYPNLEVELDTGVKNLEEVANLVRANSEVPPEGRVYNPIDSLKIPKSYSDKPAVVSELSNYHTVLQMIYGSHSNMIDNSFRGKGYPDAVAGIVVGSVFESVWRTVDQECTQEANSRIEDTLQTELIGIESERKKQESKLKNAESNIVVRSKEVEEHKLTRDNKKQEYVGLGNSYNERALLISNGTRNREINEKQDRLHFPKLSTTGYSVFKKLEVPKERSRFSFFQSVITVALRDRVGDETSSNGPMLSELIEVSTKGIGKSLSEEAGYDPYIALNDVRILAAQLGIEEQESVELLQLGLDKNQTYSETSEYIYEMMGNLTVLAVERFGSNHEVFKGLSSAKLKTVDILYKAQLEGAFYASEGYIEAKEASKRAEEDFNKFQRLLTTAQEDERSASRALKAIDTQESELNSQSNVDKSNLRQELLKNYFATDDSNWKYPEYGLRSDGEGVKAVSVSKLGVQILRAVVKGLPRDVSNNNRVREELIASSGNSYRAGPEVRSRFLDEFPYASAQIIEAVLQSDHPSPEVASVLIADLFSARTDNPRRSQHKGYQGYPNYDAGSGQSEQVLKAVLDGAKVIEVIPSNAHIYVADGREYGTNVKELALATESQISGVATFVPASLLAGTRTNDSRVMLVNVGGRSTYPMVVSTELDPSNDRWARRGTNIAGMILEAVGASSNYGDDRYPVYAVQGDVNSIY
jgi:hypothetical protein